MSPTIVAEDDHIIAVNKSAGQVVIPGRNLPPGHIALVTEVSGHVGARVFVVHRIDRETSGLVLFAKDAPTHRALSMLFESRSVLKTYLAVVHGALAGDGRVDQPLKEFGSGRMGVAPRGKPAVTSYSVRGPAGPHTLLSVVPHTGRRHQIRVHLHSIGHPVVGDPLYGTPAQRRYGGRMMLHALSLSLPWQHGELEIEASVDADWTERLQDLRSSPP